MERKERKESHKDFSRYAFINLSVTQRQRRNAKKDKVVRNDVLSGLLDATATSFHFHLANLLREEF